MIDNFTNIFRKKKKYKDIDPDEIFLDSQNLPQFNIHQFEGRIEKPISSRVIITMSVLCSLIAIIFIGRVWNLQVTSGELYRNKSENIRLKNQTLFSNRGEILDREERPLASNTINTENPDITLRKYVSNAGVSTLLGYIAYPAKDSSGNYYEKNFKGVDGLEKIYNTILSGTNGTQLTETDAKGNVTSQSIQIPAQDGKNLITSIDIDIQKKLYQSMLDYSTRAGYQGGAGVIMDVTTGEIIAMANFPEYDSNVMSLGDDRKKINEYLSNKNNPFLNRAVSGLYTPGSIVKPFIAMGVLTENIIDPFKQILSTGSISIPNPYDPSKPSIFRDWKALGWVDLRHALAMSSDVYFYEVGGGFQGQKGLGIANIEKYLRIFGFGSKTGIELSGEKLGIIPNPEWKAENFNNEPWRVGDTYNTSIGQYGLQITPLQAVRAVATIANDGESLLPTIVKVDSNKKTIYEQTNLNPEYFDIVKEGMRLAVTSGTVQSLNVPYVKVSAKSGTAELGVAKAHVNSWIIGFFPSDAPKYAFAVVMEKGVANNQIGASLVMREVLDYMSIYKAEYLK